MEANGSNDTNGPGAGLMAYLDSLADLLHATSEAIDSISDDTKPAAQELHKTIASILEYYLPWTKDVANITSEHSLREVDFHIHKLNSTGCTRAVTELVRARRAAGGANGS